MAIKRMQIGGMTCEHCEQTVAEALTSAGARTPEISWRRGQATFEAADFSDRQLARAVEEAGYKVVSIQDATGTKRGLGPLVDDNAHEDDLIVIGSGSAAFAAAIPGTEAGGRVAVLGGTRRRAA